MTINPHHKQNPKKIQLTTLLLLIMAAWIMCVLASVAVVGVAAHVFVAVLWVCDRVRKVSRNTYNER